MCVLLSAFLFVTACYFDEGELVFYNSFAYDLRGTWVTNGTSDYSGSLEIEFNRIIISGYAPNPSYESIHGTAHRPFKDFTKDTPLIGYSEDGQLFINDAGKLQEGISYNYYTTNFGMDKFIRIDFNGREETLRKVP